MVFFDMDFYERSTCGTTEVFLRPRQEAKQLAEDRWKEVEAKQVENARTEFGCESDLFIFIFKCNEIRFV